MSGHVFISHSSRDDGFVKELREALEGLGLEVWADSRELAGGAKLAPEIEKALESARQFVAVLSTNAFNSPWVRREIQKALEVEAERGGEGYKVIPLLLPGVEPSSLPLFFGEEPVGVRVEVRTGGLSEALPALLAALGERLPHDPRPAAARASQPVEELILKLDDLKVLTEDGKRRARAVAQLVYDPADAAARAVESRRFNFTAPLGVLEAEELRWYLEEFYVWPIGVFQERAARVEARLPEWGRALYDAALAPQAAQETLRAWQQAGAEGERRFSVFVERELPEGASPEEQAAADEAAAELLALPWELLHDGRGFLFHGEHAARVRRRLPNRHTRKVTPTRLPIRILLVSPRPEDERTPYLDHRISARPLIEALESLGELAKLSILTPPTFPALEKTLRKAADAGEPFDVVHFDGHGVYDRRVGLGALCFEDPKDAEELGRRAVQLIHAEKLAEVIRDRGIPLVFLEACQTAKTEDDPTASVAAKLLEEGVASVVAMSHTVLVETARRFVKAFYGELAAGRRVGTAMIEGQRELHRDDYRGKLMGAGDLRLQDWFVPVLYQEEQDAQLFTRLPSEDVRQLQAAQRRLSLGHLPELPHEFQGRSRELLKLERLLAREPYAVIRGRGGEGKTTLAVELARWLVRTARHARAAFVSFEQYTDARQMLIGIGRQLLPEGDKWHVGQDEDLKAALQPVERALRDRPTVIVLDNLESVLPDHTGQQPPGAAPLPELFGLCRRLLDASPSTRIIFTTREPLPAPFDRRGNEIALGALAREDAVALVGEVLKQEGLTPKADDPGGDPKEITDLVEAVDRHARALVLLARELARGGVRATTDNLRRLMADLDRKHPGDRENSLYASLELSLRRLPPATREQLKPLAVFHGGAHLGVLMQMLGAEQEAVESLARQLIEVGLAAYMGDNHLRLDPALPAYLLREVSEAEQEELRAVWAEGMFALTNFLYAQRFKDVELSSRLTLLELPNLLSLLTWAQDKAAPEAVIDLANRCETLFSFLGLRQALAQATKVREQAAEKLGEWNHAQFLTESADIDRLLERGEVRAAYAAADGLLKRCLSEGEGAYANAGYDIAYVQAQLGRVLRSGGAAEAALAQLSEAGRRFQALADAGNTSASGMASAVIKESGDCLVALGRLDEAAAAYEEAIKRHGALDDKRGVAVGKAQLGTTRMLQQRYDEALEIYDEVRRIFESLNEPTTVAIALHQVGMIYKRMEQFEQAERAYRQSLAIEVQQKDLAGEAASLSELGVLYGMWGRLEEAAKCFRQAADIYVRLKDENHEGVVRNNLAFALFQMQQYDEARRQLLRAIECKGPYGHAATIWNAWNILHDLEQVTNNAEAAAQARARAVESYLAYRRAGGQSMDFGAQLCAAAAQAIEQGETAELEQQLARLSGADVAPSAKVLFAKVQAVLRGERDGTLADDPELNYADAVELQLMLEALGPG
ncbi:MAG TPA: tetratricopeptide repeat protein [Pyrinomonadaceae bacterium]|nr:tetratricopeptide repeat protein [Pyrinomonadaceae bacterium]